MNTTIEATIDVTEAAARTWDVVVVGAGPAGSSTAIVLAREGKRVLLLDKKHFPRAKVCGCCMSADAMSRLDALGVADTLHALGAQPLTRFNLASGGRIARIPLRGSVALSRAALDALLVRDAVEAGAHFVSGARAADAGEHARGRSVAITCAGRDIVLDASVVVVADGLAGRFSVEPDSVVCAASLMGAGIVLASAPDEYAQGELMMACGAGGYVGLVRLEDGALDIGAALQPQCVRNVGGPGAAVAQILHDAGLPAIRNLESQQWKGTPMLTRRAMHVARSRLFRVGDTTGYVEPFTGEGIAWALRSGIAVAGLAAKGATAWADEYVHEWTALHHRLVRRQQRRCFVLTRALRHWRVMHLAVMVLSVVPGLATPLVRLVTEGIVRPARLTG